MPPLTAYTLQSRRLFCTWASSESDSGTLRRYVQVDPTAYDPSYVGQKLWQQARVYCKGSCPILLCVFHMQRWILERFLVLVVLGQSALRTSSAAPRKRFDAERSVKECFCGESKHRQSHRVAVKPNLQQP